jgi:predicted DNA-binding transcriptional regulator AlpA
MLNPILRYNDLKRSGVVNNRATLYRWIKYHGFPPGVLIGPNSRAWSEKDVLDWLDSRPSTGQHEVPSKFENTAQAERLQSKPEPTDRGAFARCVDGRADEMTMPSKLCGRARNSTCPLNAKIKMEKNYD